MSEDHKRQYAEAAIESAAHNYASLHGNEENEEAYKYTRAVSAFSFVRGAEYAHHIAHSEGYNEALDAAAKLVWNHRFDELPSIAEINDELQKLRK